MPRETHTTSIIMLLPALIAVLVMLIVYEWERSRVRVIQRDVPPVACDPIIEFAKVAREAAWRNPMEGRGPDMPGGLR